jgi:DNA-binding transcriptional MerR regulator
VTKSPDAFRTISEVAEDLDLPQHVLRFWETRFGQIRPLKRGGGRRYYRPEDVDLLKGIKHLLYDEGYTIRGLQRILKEQGNKFVVAVGAGEIVAGAEPPEPGLPPAGSAPEEDDEPSGMRKAAVAVADLGAKPKRLFDRLVGRDPERDAAVPAGSNPALSGQDRRALQATLYELLECKRLLDQVRSN